MLDIYILEFILSSEQLLERNPVPLGLVITHIFITDSNFFLCVLCVSAKRSASALFWSPNSIRI